MFSYNLPVEEEWCLRNHSVNKKYSVTADYHVFNSITFLCKAVLLLNFYVVPMFDTRRKEHLKKKKTGFVISTQSLITMKFEHK